MHNHIPERTKCLLIITSLYILVLSQFKYFNFVFNHFLENSVEDEKMLSVEIGVIVALMAKLNSFAFLVKIKQLKSYIQKLYNLSIFTLHKTSEIFVYKIPNNTKHPSILN